jgi:hypothetical protein
MPRAGKRISEAWKHTLPRFPWKYRIGLSRWNRKGREEDLGLIMVRKDCCWEERVCIGVGKRGQEAGGLK